MILDSQITYAIVTGIVSGILTSAIIWLLHKFFVSIFTPWLDQRLYRGVNISGTWQGVVRGDPSQDWKLEMTLCITQKAYKICGTLQAKTSATGYEYINRYKIKGKILNNYLILEYLPESQSRIGLGTFVLNVQKGGQNLAGATSFLAEGTNSIGSHASLSFDKID